MKIINYISVLAVVVLSLPFMAIAQDTSITPNTGIITGASTVCIGSSTVLADKNVGGMWSSSDNSVATVTTKGNVTGIAAGTATISYTYAGDDFALTIDVITITVNTPPAHGTTLGTTPVIEPGIILNDNVPGIWGGCNSYGFDSNAVIISSDLTNTCSAIISGLSDNIVVAR